MLIGSIIAYVKLPNGETISPDDAHSFYYILFFCAIGGLAVITFSTNTPPLEENTAPRLSLGESISSTFALLKTPDMLFLAGEWKEGSGRDPPPLFITRWN